MIIKKAYLLSEIRKTTPDVTTFIFKAQDGSSIDFIPGMFAMLGHKDPETGEDLSRAFSIANAPPSDALEFFISMIHGKLTSKLESAKIGDVYTISAPYGQFKFDINAGRRVLFLAGGTGIAPFFSMLRFAKAKNADMDCSIIYSVKYPYDIIEKDELEEMRKSMNLKVAITVTRPQPGDNWTGETGHVDANMIAKYAPDFKERVIYICGPPPFVKALKDSLVSIGIEEKNIKAEMWG